MTTTDLMTTDRYQDFQDAVRAVIARAHPDDDRATYMVLLGRVLDEFGLTEGVFEDW